MSHNDASNDGVFSINQKKPKSRSVGLLAIVSLSCIIHIYIYMTHFPLAINYSQSSVGGQKCRKFSRVGGIIEVENCFPAIRWIAVEWIGITVADRSYRFYIENTDSLVHHSARRENGEMEKFEARIFLIEEQEEKRKSTREDPIFSPSIRGSPIISPPTRAKLKLGPIYIYIYITSLLTTYRI